jgi:hypothetical protein
LSDPGQSMNRSSAIRAKWLLDICAYGIADVGNL